MSYDKHVKHHKELFFIRATNALGALPTQL